MKKRTYRFSAARVDYYLATGFSHLKKITDQRSTILLTDENVYEAQAAKFKGWNTIILDAGEEHKVHGPVYVQN